MAGNNFDTSITIRVGTDGISDLNQLINAIEQAGGDVTHLRTQAQQLNNVWNSLSTDEQTRQLNALTSSANATHASLGTLGSAGATTATALSHIATNASSTASSLGGVGASVGSTATSIGHLGSTSTTTATSLGHLGTASSTSATSTSHLGTSATTASTAMGGLGTSASTTATPVSHLGAASATASSAVSHLGTTSGSASASMGHLGTTATSASTALHGTATSSQAASGGIDKLTKNLMGLAGSYIGIDAVKSGIEELVETSKQMDSLNQKLEYATGGAKEAGETFSYLKDVAGELALNQMDLANGYAQLASATKNLNMSQADTRTAFEGVAKATAAMSLTADEANGVFLALSQIASKGKVSMEELRGQLGERLTPAFGIAAQAMGVTTGELEKMVESGINAREFLPKFGAALSQSFNEQAANNIHTTTGEINLLTNKMTDLKVKILDWFAGDALASGTQAFSDAIDYVSNAIDNIDPTTVEAVKAVFASIFDVVGTLGTQLQEVYNDFNTSFSSMTAIFGETNDNIGFVTRTMQGLSIVIGAVSDALNDVALVVNFLRGGMEAFLSESMQNFSVLIGELSKIKLLPEGMRQAFEGISQNLDNASKKMQKASDDSFKAMEKNIDNQGKSTERALNATIVTADQMATFSEKASQRAIASFEKIAKDGSASGESLKNSFGEAVAKATNPEQVEGLIAKLTELKNKGKITGEELAQGMDIAKPKLDELRAKFGQSTDSLEKLGLVGEKTAQDIKTKMADTATTLGLDFDKASTKTTQNFEKVAGAVLDVGLNFDKLKSQGYNATNLVEQGITKMIASAKNKSDFDVLNAIITKMGNEGKLSGDQVAKGLEESRKKSQELEASLTGTTNAYKTLGLQSQAELQKKAQEYKQAYDTIAKDATASEAIKQQAFTKYAQAVIDGNNGVMTSEVKAQAVARGYAEISVENGKIATKTAQQIEEANQKAEQSHKKVGNTALESAEKSKQAAEQQAQAVGSMTDVIASMMDNFTASISKGLQTVGITSEQSLALSQKAMTDMASGLTGTWDNFFSRFGDMQQRMNADIAQFNAMRDGAIRMTQALGGASVGVNELAEAQHALRHAQDANIDGIVRMDNATLDNLKRQIDGTRQKLDDMAKSAKATADNLEADLARIKGDDAVAQKLEQTRKLTELQEKLNDAQKRGNSEEISQLQRAIELQKQYNAEQTKQAEAKKQEAYNKQLDEQNKLITKQASDIAKAKGDDIAQLKIEQNQKLWDMEAELEKAKKSNNADAIANARLLIELRKKANDEEYKQLQQKLAEKSAQEAEKRAKEQAKADKERIDSQKALLDNQERLAKLGGDDVELVKIEQKKKLLDLENQLAAAKADGNKQEIELLTRLIELQNTASQKEIENAEAKKLAKEQSSVEIGFTQPTAKVNQSDDLLNVLKDTARTSPTVGNFDTATLARDVVASFETRIQQIKKEAIEEFVKQIADEAKRSAR